jgi:hypothetical protein
MPRIATVLGLLALLLPSAAFVWTNSDAPLFGYQHDDGIYYVTAKALATGQGYTIPSLPGSPAQTKYPPGLPLTLAPAWIINPEFPANLRIASWIMWLWLPVLLGVSFAFWQRLGFSGWRHWTLAAMLALNAYILYFTSTFLSEIPFAVFLFAALLTAAAEADGAKRRTALAAGVLASIAFLFRTIGIAALALPVLWFVRGERERATRFLVGFLPLSLGWIAWSNLHQTATSSEIVLYYTNYLRYHFTQFEWSSAHLFLWHNVDGFLTGIGGLILPSIYESQIAHILTQVMGVAAIAGVVRLVRSGNRIALFAAAVATPFTALLLIWSFPPNERFVIPLAPLVWAGFLTEIGHIGGGIVKNFRHKDKGQRVAAGIMTAICCAMLGWIAYGNWELRTDYLPQLVQSQRERRASGETAQQWIREHTPMQATILNGYDSELYLRTGRQGARYIPPVRFWYHEDSDGRLEHLAKTAQLAQANGMQYVYITAADHRSDLDPEQQSAIAKKIAASPSLEQVAKFPKGAIYRLTSGGEVTDILSIRLPSMSSTSNRQPSTTK